MTTTETENMRCRIEFLEQLIRKAYDRLQSGEPIQPNSEAHRDFGIVIGEIDPKATNWGFKKQG